MGRLLPRICVLVFFLGCISSVASADGIPVGVLSYDAISASTSQFDITNLTGTNSFPPGFPITAPPLSISVSDLVVNFTSGPSVTLPGSDFTVVDPEGDLNCNASACNFFGDSVASGVLTGMLSPTTGLSGLPAGDTGIDSAFTTTLGPSCAAGVLVAGCDAAAISATGISGIKPPPVPEPQTWSLLAIGLIGLLAVRRFISNITV